MTQSTPELPVTQADRDAAAAFLEFDSWEEAERLNRRAPELAEMHAFARLRIEHNTDRNAVLVEAAAVCRCDDCCDAIRALTTIGA